MREDVGEQAALGMRVHGRWFDRSQRLQLLLSLALLSVLRSTFIVQVYAGVSFVSVCAPQVLLFSTVYYVPLIVPLSAAVAGRQEHARSSWHDWPLIDQRHAQHGSG